MKKSNRYFYLKNEKNYLFPSPRKRRRKIAITLCIIASIFLGVIGYEINRHYEMGILTREKEEIKPGILLSFQEKAQELSFHSEDEKIPALIKQNERQAQKIKELKRELLLLQQQLHELKTAFFPLKHSLEKTQLKYAGELLVAKEKTNRHLRQAIVSLEKELSSNLAKMLQMESSFDIMLDLIEHQRMEKDEIEQKHKNNFHVFQQTSREEKEELAKKIKEHEEKTEQLELDIDQKNKQITQLEQDLDQQRALTKENIEKVEFLIQNNPSSNLNFQVDELLARWELERGLLQELEKKSEIQQTIHEEKDFYTKILQENLDQLHVELNDIKEVLESNKHLQKSKELELETVLDYLDRFKERASLDLSSAHLALEELQNKILSLELERKAIEQAREEQERSRLLFLEELAEFEQKSAEDLQGSMMKYDLPHYLLSIIKKQDKEILQNSLLISQLKEEKQQTLEELNPLQENYHKLQEMLEEEKSQKFNFQQELWTTLIQYRAKEEDFLELAKNYEDLLQKSESLEKAFSDQHSAFISKEQELEISRTSNQSFHDELIDQIEILSKAIDAEREKSQTLETTLYTLQEQSKDEQYRLIEIAEELTLRNIEMNQYITSLEEELKDHQVQLIANKQKHDLLNLELESQLKEIKSHESLQLAFFENLELANKNWQYENEKREDIQKEFSLLLEQQKLNSQFEQQIQDEIAKLQDIIEEKENLLSQTKENLLELSERNNALFSEYQQILLRNVQLEDVFDTLLEQYTH